MKLALAAALVLLVAPTSFADDGADLVYVQPGATQPVTIPFAIGGTTLSSPKVARVELDAPHRRIDVVGVREGKTKITVTERGHPAHVYTVYVIVSKHVHAD